MEADGLKEECGVAKARSEFSVQSRGQNQQGQSRAGRQADSHLRFSKRSR